jgi:hypothetical protein
MKIFYPILVSTLVLAPFTLSFGDVETRMNLVIVNETHEKLHTSAYDVCGHFSGSRFDKKTIESNGGTLAGDLKIDNGDQFREKPTEKGCYNQDKSVSISFYTPNNTRIAEYKYVQNINAAPYCYGWILDSQRNKFKWENVTYPKDSNCKDRITLTLIK